VVLRSSERSKTRASSHTAKPAALWPPPRTAISTPCSRPNRTQVMTSAVSRQRAMPIGRCRSLRCRRRVPRRTQHLRASSGRHAGRRPARQTASRRCRQMRRSYGSPPGGSREIRDVPTLGAASFAQRSPACARLRRPGNAGNGKPNASLRKVTLAAPGAAQRCRAPTPAAPRSAGASEPLPRRRGQHPHHLGQPPQVVVGLPDGALLH